jgi:hypothetical protein
VKVEILTELGLSGGGSLGIIERVYRERDFIRPSAEIERDEPLAAVHSYLTDMSYDAELLLEPVERAEEEEVLSGHPTPDSSKPVADVRLEQSR